MEIDASSPATRHESLEEKNTRLREELDDCRALILELNRPDNRFTDRDAQEKFGGLHNHIENWLDDFLSGNGRYCGWDKTLPAEQYAKRYNSVGIPESLFPLEAMMPLPGVISWLKEQRCRDRFMFSLVIWQFLERAVFVDDMPLGIRESSRKDINDIYAVMASRRISRAIKWRSETLTAMIQTTRFHDRRDREIEKTASKLQEELRSCVLNGKQMDLFEFCRKSVQLAAELQAELRSCLSFYAIGFPPLPEPMHDFPREWNIRSMDTWRSPTSDTTVRPVKTLIPGLYRETAFEGTSETIEIVKPVIVVRGENDGHRSRRSSQSTPSTRSPRSSVRSKETTGEEAKGRKPTPRTVRSAIWPSAWSRKTGKGVLSSDERGPKIRLKEEAGAGQRATREPYSEGDPVTTKLYQDHRHGASLTTSREPSSSSEAGASQESLPRKGLDPMYEDNRARTWPVEPRHRGISASKIQDDNLASRERVEYHSTGGVITVSFDNVAMSTTPRKVGM